MHVWYTILRVCDRIGIQGTRVLAAAAPTYIFREREEFQCWSFDQWLSYISFHTKHILNIFSICSTFSLTLLVGGKVLKEEPDDALTHLAPTTGDVCIPLDESAPLFGEMFDGLILPDSYGTLLAMDDMGDGDGNANDSICMDSVSHMKPLPPPTTPTSSTHQLQQQLQQQLHQHQQEQMQSQTQPSLHHHAIVDPYMSYREDSSCDTIGTPNQLSPSDYSKVIIWSYLTYCLSM